MLLLLGETLGRTEELLALGSVISVYAPTYISSQDIFMMICSAH